MTAVLLLVHAIGFFVFIYTISISIFYSEYMHLFTRTHGEMYMLYSYKLMIFFRAREGFWLGTWDKKCPF